MVRRLRPRPPFLPPLRAYEVLAALHVAAVFLLIRWVAFFDVSLRRTLWDQLPFALTLAGLTAAGFLLRALLVRRRDGPARAALLLRAAVRPTALLDVARFVLFTLLAAHGYTWLKIFLPLLNPALHDAALARLDAALHFGLDVNRFTIELIPSPALWRLIDGYYMLFLPSILVGLGWFASALSLKERARFAAGFALLWIAGSWFYLAVPSLGPCYAFPSGYETVRASLPVQTATQETLMHHYRSVRSLRERGEEGMVVSPVLGVAAMPSLHVAGQAFLAFFARRRSRPLFVVFAAATALTFYGSLVTGWHYAVDGYAGLLLAWLCYRAAGAAGPGRLRRRA